MNGSLTATTTHEASLLGWTNVIYALHAFSLAAAIIGPAMIIVAFLTGWPSLIAVILNYLKRSEAQGTWLESHFRWQIRTFWFGLLWVALCAAFVLGTLFVGLIVALPAVGFVALWFIYRIGRGWLALSHRKPMYV